VTSVDAFLLSREWRDADDGVEIVLWGRSVAGPVRARFTRQEAVMFVLRDTPTRAGRRVPRPLATLSGEPIDAVYFRSQRALLDERDRLREAMHVAFESDVKPSDRFVMERFVTGAMRLTGTSRLRRGVLEMHSPSVTAVDLRLELSVLALDIETEGFDGPLLSAAVATHEESRVFVRRAPPEEPTRDNVVFVRDERELLTKLFAAVVAIDPDVICGWNVLEFDLALLESRARELGVSFALGRGGERARIVTSAGRASMARVPGRVVLDGIATLKAATWSFDRFTLEHVASELLGEGKRIAKGSPRTRGDGSGRDRVREIVRMYAEDVNALVEYNLHDCRLVLDIFAKADLVGFAMERARLTGLPMDRQGGSVAAFDHLYLPRLHRRGFVAPDVATVMEPTPSPGGHVLEALPGLYRDVLSFDFRSLYPSIIRTFQIDPLGLAQPGPDPIRGEEGALFARSGAILPEMIRTLHEARGAATASGNAALGRAIKILMNSFYGVLGTPGCRFFDPRLPTSITRRGHEIIEHARAFFEARDLRVVYGDTDSLFVLGPEANGQALADALNAELRDKLAREHRVESHLELRFDAHYLRFLMPTTRGADRGSKKRYAGLKRSKHGGTELVVRGLEAVRRDWTPLARRVQLELLRRVFADEPFEAWLLGVARDLAAGLLDDELVYTKRLRRDPSAYEGTVPPHVRAARKRADPDDASDVDYVVTTQGPEPVEERTAPIDHAHYLGKQLEPACDVVLPFVGTSFARIAGAQQSLF
jgi:DNA polymerase II